MPLITEETKRWEPQGPGTPPEEHALEVTFPVFPSIEGYHELALHRTREGPGCIRVNGLLIVDPFCPICRRQLLEQLVPRASGPPESLSRR